MSCGYDFFCVQPTSSACSDLVNEKRFFHLGPKKTEFMRQLTLDADFLAKMNIMDYSLLV